ncbi:hypothetical protein [Sphingomonas palmae]|nr:hypothetical protein [Sphingomonas palmae]
MAAKDFTGAPMCRDVFERALTDLATYDFVEVYKGDRAFRDREGFITRILPLPRLTDLCATFGVIASEHRRHFTYCHKADCTPPIQLRAATVRSAKWKARGKLLPVDYEDPRVKHEAARVRALNAFIRAHVVTGPVEAQLDEIALYRGFNQGDQPGHDYRLGGRIYADGGSYQQLSSLERSRIRFNGEPVAEVDISACFLTIAYALTGTPLPSTGDPYSGPKLERAVVKAWVNMTLSHTRFHKRWPTEVVEDLAQRGFPNLRKTHPIKRVENEIRAKLPVMANWPAVPISWPELFYEESEIMMDAMERLMSLGIIGLPVHDSLLIPPSKMKEGIKAIQDAFYNRLGIMPKVEAKGTS